MYRYNGDATVGVPQEVVTAFGANYGESDAIEAPR
jgi:hypothetical protein